MDSKKLESIYQFLNSNRQYNKALHSREYQSIIDLNASTEDRVVSLLYHVANTQSQPKIDKLAIFYKKIYADIDGLVSFSRFIEILSGKPSHSFYDLFSSLKKQDGWGDKTSALFVKSIYHLHNNEYDKRLSFWPDVPQKLEANDKFLLPVDAVIIHIFKCLGLEKPSFSKVNTLLYQQYGGFQIEVWDDLWFWGFITQRTVKGGSRLLEWNENKYWALEHTSKCPKDILEIKEHAEEFIELIKPI